MVINPFFNTVINLIIIVNTALLATDKYPELDANILQAFNNINYVFIAIFTLDVIIKFIGLGPKIYIKDKFNLFDLGIVVISLVEISIV